MRVLLQKVLLASLISLLGCTVTLEHAARHPVAYDVADAVVIAAASGVAIGANDGTAQGAAIGVDVLALVAIPFLVVATVLANWSPE